MKKFVIAMVALLGTIFTSADAMSYEQAREQALFLTDKMAYELNLNEEQYEAAYEVNLDYLLGVNSYDDVYGDYWAHRNADLRYILYDWQYDAYCAATYFYRPIWWADGFWHFGIYSRYPHRDYFYFGRPDFYATYRGGHSWRMNGGHSWYDGRSFGPRNRGEFSGMRDGWNRGDYRGRQMGAGRQGGGNRQMGAGRQMGSGRQMGGSRQSGGNRQMGAGRQMGGQQSGRTNGGSFGGNRGTVGASQGMQSGAPRQSSTRTTVGRQGGFSGSRGGSSVSGGSFSPSRSSAAPSRSMSASSQSRGGGSSMGSGSRGGGSSMDSGSRGGGSSMGGGSHGGGRR